MVVQNISGWTIMTKVFAVGHCQVRWIGLGLVVSALWLSSSWALSPGTCTGGQACARLQIVTQAILPPSVGVPYSFALTAIGGTPPYSWNGNTLTPDGSTNGLTIGQTTG